MLRSEFDQHPLWTRAETIRSMADNVRSQGKPEELPLLERIEFYVGHVESFRSMPTTTMPFFTQQMLDNVLAALSDPENGLQNRLNMGSGSGYLEAAATTTENVLNVMGNWPRPPLRGGQVQATSTLFEDLLEVQRKSIAALIEQHDRFRGEINELDLRVEQRKDEALSQLDELRATALQIGQTVDEQKTRIDRVAEAGSASIDNLRTTNSEQYKAWIEEQQQRFTADFNPLRKAIDDDLRSANERLEALKNTEVQFANLASVAAGQTMANHFEKEAKFSRRAGFIAYGFGFVFLIGAAIPLIFLLFDPSLDRSGTIEWGRIIVRIALATVAGSAATVVIRLGGRLLGDAGRAKRMELELRAFDPFMSNVADRDAVDVARVELVDRTFGRAAGVIDEKSEVLPVSTFTTILQAASRLVGK